MIVKNSTISNINFIPGKVENLIDDVKDNYDTIIIDPPRSGVDKKVLDTIILLKPESIIYVSCDIMTLQRDLNILYDNYNIIEVIPFDMFP